MCFGWTSEELVIIFVPTNKVNLRVNPSCSLAQDDQQFSWKISLVFEFVTSTAGWLVLFFEQFCFVFRRFAMNWRKSSHFGHLWQITRLIRFASKIWKNQVVCQIIISQLRARGLTSVRYCPILLAAYLELYSLIYTQRHRSSQCIVYLIVRGKSRLLLSSLFGFAD